MSKIMEIKVASIDKLCCTHRIEVIIEFDEPTSFFKAQEIVSNAMGDYMCKQHREQMQKGEEK